METGQIGEAIAVARRDLAPPAKHAEGWLDACAPEQDGWVLDVAPDTAVTIDADNARANFDAVELRVRVDPGRACVERVAARTPGLYPAGPKPAGGADKPLTAVPGRKGKGEGDAAIPLAVNERSTGRRWGLSCALKRR
jgi:hypothetical protein